MSVSVYLIYIPGKRRDFGNGAEVEFQMHYRRSNERAVSPVVGVMLMSM